MGDVTDRCSVCRALLDEEDLFCANCGTEAPYRQAAATTVETAVHTFECQGCGASMSFDAAVGRLRCPFCGGEATEETAAVKSLAANRIVPFRVARDEAVADMRRWLGQGFWRPSDLSARAAVTAMTAVYVPYWVFQARTHTYWTADTNQLPFGSSGDWRPVSGEHRGDYAGVLIGASGVLTPHETNAICPFDLTTAVPLDQVDRSHVAVEQFRVQRKYARPLARQGLEDLERRACEQYVPGKARQVKVNVRLDGMSSEPVLLPVWIMAYSYQDRVYRFLVNGQNGRTTGQAPVSVKKILAAVAIAILCVIAFLICAGMIAVAANGAESLSEKRADPLDVARFFRSTGAAGAGQTGLRQSWCCLSMVIGWELLPPFRRSVLRAEGPAVCQAQPNGLGKQAMATVRANGPAIWQERRPWSAVAAPQEQQLWRRVRPLFGQALSDLNRYRSRYVLSHSSIRCSASGGTAWPCRWLKRASRAGSP